MSERALQSTLDQVRSETLDRIARAERLSRLAIIGASLVELLFLLAFVFLADFHDRTQLLLFLSAIALYWMVGLGLLILGAHVSRNTQLVLKTLGTLAESAG
jgi:hypothetical protein